MLAESQEYGSFINENDKIESKHQLIRSVGVFNLAIVGFFSVCGGPFGIEVAVGAAGPLYTFLSLLILPVIWAIPQACMTIELSSMIPENGGYVVWVREAFGEFGSWMSGCCGVCSNLFDIALYPTIFASYLQVLVSMTWIEAYCLKLSLLLFGLILNIRGMKEIGHVAGILTLSIFIPYFVQLFMELDKIKEGGNAWKQTPGEDDETDWGLFTSTILWSYTGWDAVGCIAGEVINPGRTYPIGFVLAISLVTAMYFLPLFIAIQTHPNWQEYEDGTLGDIADNFSPWMGVWIVVTSMLCNVGLFLIALSTSGRALWAMAVVSDENHKHNSNVKRFQILPKWVAYESPTYGTPSASLIIHAMIVCVLLLGDFELLVETEVILISVNLLFEFAAYIWFRWYQPTRERPWKVPFGWYGVWAITTPKLAVLCFALVTADLLSWALAGGLILILLLTYIISNFHHKKQNQRVKYEKIEEIDVSYTQ